MKISIFVIRLNYSHFLWYVYCYFGENKGISFRISNRESEYTKKLFNQTLKFWIKNDFLLYLKNMWICFRLVYKEFNCIILRKDILLLFLSVFNFRGLFKILELINKFRSNQITNILLIVFYKVMNIFKAIKVNLNWNIDYE